MFDLPILTNVQQNSSITLLLLSVLMTFLLSLVLVFTYEKTTHALLRHDHFIQSMFLLAMVTSTVMQSIGDSMARSFGIFGALAILRFRTNISDPRNVSFVFAAMAVGIACGVYSFLSAIVGTIAFCIIAFILRFTPFSTKLMINAELRFELLRTSTRQEEILQLIQKFSSKQTLKRYRDSSVENKVNYLEYEYQISYETDKIGFELTKALAEIRDIRDIRLTIEETNKE